MAVNPPPGLVVFVGGAIGATTRAALEWLVPDPAAAIPITTLAINLSGSFALGLLLRSLALRGPDHGQRRALRLGLGTGVLGGYTTFSTFAVQGVSLAEQGHLLVAASYLALSVAGGFAAAWAGTALAKKMARQP